MFLTTIRRQGSAGLGSFLVLVWALLLCWPLATVAESPAEPQRADSNNPFPLPAPFTAEEFLEKLVTLMKRHQGYVTAEDFEAVFGLPLTLDKKNSNPDPERGWMGYDFYIEKHLVISLGVYASKALSIAVHPGDYPNHWGIAPHGGRSRLQFKLYLLSPKPLYGRADGLCIAYSDFLEAMNHPELEKMELGLDPRMSLPIFRVGGEPRLRFEVNAQNHCLIKVELYGRPQRTH